MSLKNEDDVFISQLMAFTGVYRMSNTSASRKVCGYNVYKCIIVIQIIFLCVSLVCFLLNAYYCFGNINDMSKCILMIVGGVIASMKFYCIIQNTDRIYECIQSMSIVNFSYKHHAKQILELGRRKSKMLSILFVTLWICVLVAWCMEPFVVNNIFMTIRTEKNETYHYRYNVINLVFPVTDTFYNRHFYIYFVLECMVIININISLTVFDFLIIFLCTTLKYHLKTIVNSYSTFSVTHRRLIGDKLNITRQNELNLIINFKTLILDQQVVIKNIRTLYQIFGPVLLFQLATDSLMLILLSSMTIKNYFDGYSLIETLNIKLIITSLTVILHMYINCYLPDCVNEQIDSLNFAIYCSDWTEMNILYKKLLLLAMRTNDGDNLKLRVTSKKIINFEMFASVMQKTYSILSLLANQYKKKT